MNKKEVQSLLNKKLTTLYPKMIEVANINIQSGYYHGLQGRKDLVHEIVQTVSLQLLERCTREPLAFGKSINIDKMDNYILMSVLYACKKSNSTILYNIRKHRNEFVAFSDLEYIPEPLETEDTPLYFELVVNSLNDGNNPCQLLPIEKIVIDKLLTQKKTVNEICLECDIKKSKLYEWRASAIKKIKKHFDSLYGDDDII